MSERIWGALHKNALYKSTYTLLYFMDEQSGESREEEVMGERMGELEMKDLVPEWGWRRDKGDDSRD